METRIFKDTEEEIREAAHILAEGGLVAFPTETVYGLGADALNAEAVKKIYKAKGRPSDNPIIVHISSKNDLQKLTPEISPDMEKLADKFWPGPMTMVTARNGMIPHVTTGGLDTVGIRMPNNRTALLLISLSGCPVAAPSANLSGKPSPTAARHVIEDLYGRVDGIISSGDCTVGIESSVIDMTGKTPVILRPGIITREDFEKALGREVLLDPALNKRPDGTGDFDFKPRAPGMKYRHYAPKAEMIIFEGEREKVLEAIKSERFKREAEGEKVSVIDFDDAHQRDAAKAYFARLREADEEGCDVILGAALTEKGVGFSVMNRMLKSAGYNIRKV